MTIWNAYIYFFILNATFYLFYFLNFLFCIGVYLINNVVMVSGEQRRDSAIHVSILPRRLSHWTEFHVLNSRSLLVIHFKYSSVYMSIQNSQTHSKSKMILSQAVV